MTFNAKDTYTLENDAVLLRPLELSDLQYLEPFAVNEPTLWRYSLVQPVGETGMKQYISEAMSARESAHEYPFIVYDKKKRLYAGSTRFYKIQPLLNTLHLGYTWYGKDFQGTGLNKNCKYLLLKFAFEDLEMERVEFGANNSNERSKAAMKSIGCVPEGILRNSGRYKDGTRYDGIVLSILKDEWFNGVKQNLLTKTASYA